MAKINGYRRVHGAGPVLHDPTLSKAAATWANSIRNSGKAKFDPKSKYGQNICIAPKGEKDIPTTCVVDFYKTIEHYDWSTAKPTASSKLVNFQPIPNTVNIQFYYYISTNEYQASGLSSKNLIL